MAPRECREPGIFVAFEETPTRIAANAESFGWKLAQLQPRDLFFLDAQPQPDLIQSGNFDLSGMLAVLGAKIKEIKARRIVFDALDIVMALLPDAAAVRREMYRLHAWLLEHELTGLITLKAGKDDASPRASAPSSSCNSWWIAPSFSITAWCWGCPSATFAFRSIAARPSTRTESPFLIGKSGCDVAVARTRNSADLRVSTERVSTGREAARYHAGRRLLPRLERTDHGFRRHRQDYVERRVCRSRLPARRAHRVHQLRLRRERGHSQSRLGGNPARSLCEERLPCG